MAGKSKPVGFSGRKEATSPGFLVIDNPTGSPRLFVLDKLTFPSRLSSAMMDRPRCAGEREFVSRKRNINLI